MFSYLLTHNRYLNLIGIGVIFAIAWIFSRNRRAIDYRLVMNALVMQGVLAFIMLRMDIGQRVMNSIAQGVQKLYEFSDAGISFVFGSLSTDFGTPWGFVFAIKVLPIIVFFGGLMSVLFHFGIIQRLVFAISFVVRPILGTSGAETLCAVSNSFLGQTEAPLLVRHYLGRMTKSEMLVVMVSGMATISGAILAVFSKMGVPTFHLLSASVMAIPGAIAIAKVLLPETEKAETATTAEITFDQESSNIFSAIATGTTDGMYLALNVGAMLISFLALLAMTNGLLDFASMQLNALLAFVGFSFQLPMMNLNFIFSYLFAPFGYLLGFTGQEALLAGQLLGTKITVNELVAYSEMVSMQLPERFVALLTYALCGFSNFSCIGIQIGGIGALVPEKRQWLCELGLFAVLGGSLSNLLSAMIAGLLL